MDKKTLHMAACFLVYAGALNWGLVGLFQINLVTMLLGTWPMVEKLVYIVIGVSAVYDFMAHMQYCRYCNSSGKK